MVYPRIQPAMNSPSSIGGRQSPISEKAIESPEDEKQLYGSQTVSLVDSSDGDEALKLVGRERQVQFSEEYNRKLRNKLVKCKKHPPPYMYLILVLNRIVSSLLCAPRCTSPSSCMSPTCLRFLVHLNYYLKRQDLPELCKHYGSSNNRAGRECLPNNSSVELIYLLHSTIISCHFLFTLVGVFVSST